MTRRRLSRGLVSSGVAFGLGGCLGRGDGSPDATASDDVRFVELLDDEGTAVGRGRLSFDEWLTVSPAGSADDLPAVVTLVRYPEEAYEPPTDVDALVDGHAAYSKVCTHMGCEVDGREGDEMVCPCHDGTFATLAGGEVRRGPPPEPLTQLPLTARDDGTLLVDTAPATADSLPAGGHDE